jgi:uncharacterized repeat protein (TIGR01451 family)
LTVIVVSPDRQVNTATVAHSDQYDPIPDNNSASAVATPRQAELTLAKSVNNVAPTVGGTITYTVTLSNNGPDRATSVEVEDRLPSRLTCVSATPSVGTYDSSTGQWNVGSVDVGSPQTLVILAKATSTEPHTNSAMVTHADQFDPDPSSNVDGITVEPRAEVAPAVASLLRLGYHAHPTSFVLTFSSALDPARAQNLQNYVLTTINAIGQVGQRIRLVSAVYSPATLTVTLHPAHLVYLFGHYKLVVDGTAPSGLASPSGVLLDGAGNGVSGTNYVRTFGSGILAQPHPRFPGASRHVVARKTTAPAHLAKDDPHLRHAATTAFARQAHTAPLRTISVTLRPDAMDAALGAII